MTAPGDGRLLVVCTGNVCRSPYVERGLRDLLASSPGGGRVAVRSAGTRALVGAPVAPPIREALVDAGASPPDDFAARQLTRGDLEWASMVVTAERAHRAAVVRLRPAVHDRVFTLLQVQRLLLEAGGPSIDREDDPVAVLAQHCSRARGTSGRSADADDDVPDPWGGSAQRYRQSVDLMRPAVEVLAEALTPEVTR